MLSRIMRSGAVGLTMAVASLSPVCLSVPEAAGKPAATAADSTRLTLDSFHKFLEVEDRLSGKMTRDRAMEAAMAINGDNDSFQAWLHRLESSSEGSDAFKAAGVSPREYLRTLVTLFKASTVASFKKQGKQVPEALQKSVPAENVAFVEAHWTEIDAWTKKSKTPAIQPNTIEDLYEPAAENDKANEKGKAPEAEAPKSP